MSATINATGHSHGITRSGPMGFVIGAILVAGVAAGSFAIGRASSDPQTVAGNALSVSAGAVHPERGTVFYRRTRPAIVGETARTGSVTVGAVHPERGTIVYRRTAPAIVGESGGPLLMDPSDSATRDRQRHHPKQTK